MCNIQYVSDMAYRFVHINENGMCVCTACQLSARGLLTDATGRSVTQVPNIPLNMKPHERATEAHRTLTGTDLKMMSCDYCLERLILNLVLVKINGEAVC